MKFSGGSTSNQQPVTSDGYQLRVTSYQLPVTGYQPPVTSYQLPATSYHLSVTSFQLSATSYQIPDTSYQIPATVIKQYALLTSTNPGRRQLTDAHAERQRGHHDLRIKPQPHDSKHRVASLDANDSKAACASRSVNSSLWPSRRIDDNGADTHRSIASAQTHGNTGALPPHSFRCPTYDCSIDTYASSGLSGDDSLSRAKLVSCDSSRRLLPPSVHVLSHARTRTEIGCLSWFPAPTARAGMMSVPENDLQRAIPAWISSLTNAWCTARRWSCAMPAWYAFAPRRPTTRATCPGAVRSRRTEEKSIRTIVQVQVTGGSTRCNAVDSRIHEIY